MNLNVNNISLDTMLSITEFRSLGTEEKQQAVMRLVPLFKPYICSIVDKLCGLDYTIGEANSHLDVIDRPPKYSRIQGWFLLFTPLLCLTLFNPQVDSLPSSPPSVTWPQRAGPRLQPPTRSESLG